MQQIIVALLLLLAASGTALADKRVALVIGNADYQHTPKLANPGNDAADMAVALKRRGFQVIEGLNLDKPAFDRKIREFADALEGAAAGVLFYAGHGLQVGGHNYLAPVDAKLTTAAALEFEMVRLDVVHRLMERQSLTNVIFLDACRDNPLARNLARTMGTRSSEIGRGLAAVESGVGTLISFSTQPGNVALDGTGRNSPFAAALARNIATSSDDLSALLIAVRNEVMKETQRKQVPWEHSALTGRFYFDPRNAVAQPPTPSRGQDQPSEASTEWSRVDKASIAELETFLRRHGSSPEADYARARLAELKRQQHVVAPPEPSAAPHKHAFDGDWVVSGVMDNCPTTRTGQSAWTWKTPLRIGDSKVISAGRRGKGGAAEAEGHVLESGVFKFTAQGTDRVGTFTGRLQANSGRGTYKFPDCSGPARDQCCSGTLTLSRALQPSRLPEKREHAFDGTWEVDGLNGASCPKPELKWKGVAIRISSSQIFADGSVVGRVLENGKFEYTRPLSERPRVRRIFVGKLQTDSGRGTYRFSEGVCRGTILLKRV